MPIIRRKLASSDIYPDDIRYNPDTETFQSFIDGEWTDNPDGDPRRQTILPPRLTSDPACDAAQSVTDALKNQIDAILLAIDNAGNAFTIAGLILGLLTFGPFGVFIGIALAIADAMLDAGTTALSAALTEPVYEQFKCSLFCQMDSSGRITESGLGNVQAEVTAMIGGLAAVILNSMTALAGFGGINNLASLGTSTGDCSECECVEPCANAADWLAGTINSTTDNGDGTVTFNISSVDNGGGVQYAAWGDRIDPDSPCCVFIFTDLAEGTALGSATQSCGSSTETFDNLAADQCLHYFHFYKNFDLSTPWTCNVIMGAGCEA